MPTYEHLGKCCGHKWDAFYSMKDKPPTTCPNCKTEGEVERLISGGSGKGIVRLKGGELKKKVYSDAMAAKRRAATDESYMANIVGEERYHNESLNSDALTKELVRIGKDASKIRSTDVK